MILGTDSNKGDYYAGLDYEPVNFLRTSETVNRHHADDSIMTKLVDHESRAFGWCAPFCPVKYVTGKETVSHTNRYGQKWVEDRVYFNNRGF